jgi:hypothetical protein
MKIEQLVLFRIDLALHSFGGGQQVVLPFLDPDSVEFLQH